MADDQTLGPSTRAPSAMADEPVELPQWPAVEVRWGGVLGVIAFVTVTGVVARIGGPSVAGIVAIVALSGLVISALWGLHRRRAAISAADGAVEIWGPGFEGSADFGCGDIGVGGGGGGGDC